MKIHYIKSATVAIEAKGVKILTDPWLIDGEYYGAWHHYPKLDIRNDFFDSIDYIYVSHIHPDHFSKSTFSLLNKNIPVLIHRYESPFLKANIERLGFQVTELAHNTRTHLKNGVHINILAADNCNPELCSRFFGCGIVEARYGSTQIDSLAVIDDGRYCVVNSNDCLYDLAGQSLGLLKQQYPRIDMLLVGYGGAGPYPQCFIMPEEDKRRAAENKKKQFLDQGLKYIRSLEPRYVLPFAGTYVLGGRLAALQDHRGVPEIEEAAEYFRSHTEDTTEVVLLNSYAYFDLESGLSSSPYEAIDPQAKKAYIQETLAGRKLDYENEEYPSPEELKPLLELAYARFEKKRNDIAFQSETKVLLRLGEDAWCSISAKGQGYSIIDAEAKNAIQSGFVSYNVDTRLLRRILSGPRFAHWNNAEIGSHIEFERKPDIFERGLYYAMNFFHS
ncbi:MAG: MBL fold metallo-hydrolase [Bacteroidia bacterium]|nr:MBL fold metallo-hydrolase [Bacteroidia bacterium]